MLNAEQVVIVRINDTTIRTCHAIIVSRKDTLRQQKLILYLCVKTPFLEQSKAIKGHIKPRTRVLRTTTNLHAEIPHSCRNAGACLHTSIVLECG